MRDKIDFWQFTMRYQFIKTSRACWLLLAVIGLLIQGSLQWTRAGVLSVDQQLSRYIQEALQNNPELEGWQAQVDAAGKRISQAGAWQDPMVTFSLMNLPTNTFDFNQEPMTGAWINVSQSIPVNGQNGVRREIAEKQRDVLLANQRNRELIIARDVTQTWNDWAYWRLAVAINDSMVALLDDIITVAYRKYETGKGLQADILRLQTERSLLLDRRLKLQQVAKSKGQKLAVLLGRDPSNIPEVPEGLPEQFNDLQHELLVETLQNNSPSIQSADSDLEIAREKVVLNKRLWWPDLKFSAGYGYREDSDQGMERPDFFSFSAGISIPIFGVSKQGKAVEEARLQEKQALAERRSIELKLSLALETLIDMDKRLAEQIRLYDEALYPVSSSLRRCGLAKQPAHSVPPALIVTRLRQDAPWVSTGSFTPGHFLNPPVYYDSPRIQEDRHGNLSIAVHRIVRGIGRARPRHPRTGVPDSG